MPRYRVHEFLIPPLAAFAYVVVIAACVVWLPPLALLAVLGAPFDHNRRLAGRFLRLVGALPTYAYLPWRVRIEGRPPTAGAYVAVANHQSFLDVFVLSRLPREMKWLVKRELFRIPWFGWMFALAGDIPVTRGDRESGGEALTRARKYLDTGMPVMIFPEGTRSRGGSVLPFKPGAFRLAVEAQVPVLPIAVCGSADGMPKGSPWIRPTLVLVRLLEPVETKGMKGADVVRLSTVVRERIQSAEAELREQRRAEGW